MSNLSNNNKELYNRIPNILNKLYKDNLLKEFSKNKFLKLNPW